MGDGAVPDHCAGRVGAGVTAPALARSRGPPAMVLPSSQSCEGIMKVGVPRAAAAAPSAIFSEWKIAVPWVVSVETSGSILSVIRRKCQSKSVQPP